MAFEQVRVVEDDQAVRIGRRERDDQLTIGGAGLDWLEGVRYAHTNVPPSVTRIRP